jgi:hypothetical protein
MTDADITARMAASTLARREWSRAKAAATECRKVGLRPALCYLVDMRDAALVLGFAGGL